MDEITITYISINGDEIATITIKNNQKLGRELFDLMRKIKDYKYVSERTPHQIFFIPISNSELEPNEIKLEYLHDTICSPYGTIFNVIYTQITEGEYFHLYGSEIFNKCVKYLTTNNSYDSDDDFVKNPINCTRCTNCLCRIKKEQSQKQYKERLALFQTNLHP